MEDVGLSTWRCGFLLIRQLRVNVLRKMKNVLAAFRDENSSDSSSKGHRTCQGFNEIEFHQQLVKHIDVRPYISISARTGLTFFQISTPRTLKEDEDTL